MKAIVVLLIVSIFAVEGYVVKSHRKSSEEFSLVGRFCFSTGTLDGQLLCLLSLSNFYKKHNNKKF